MKSSVDLASRPIPSGIPFDHILVPLDGSGPGESVLPTVKALYRQHESQVVLVRVLEPKEGKDGNLGSLPRLEAETIAQLYLRKISADLDRAGIPSKIVVRTGEVQRCLRAVAIEERSSLICLSTHGRMTSPSAPAGETAGALLRSSAIPVLAVPPGAAAHGDTFGTVLIPLAGGGPTDDIVPVAAAFASSFGADLAVLLELVPPAETGRLDAEHHVQAEDHLAKLADAFESIQIPTVRLAQGGDPVGTIVAVAEERKADVIALRSPDRSLTEGVLRAAKVPVLTSPALPPDSPLRRTP